jgi:hypothetical protein
MKWNVTKEDVAANQLVTPGWYPTEIVGFKVKPAKDKESNNAVITCKIIGTKFAGARVELYFSEKLPVMMVPLLKAIGFEENPDGSMSVDVSEEVLKNKKFLGNWQRGEYNNRPVNNVTEFNVLQ